MTSFRQHLAAFLPGAISLGLLLGCGGAPHVNGPSQSHHLVGTLAPRSDHLGLQAGSTDPASVQLVGFWASTCPGCDAALTAMSQLQDDHKGVTATGICIDETRDACETKRQAHSKSVKFMWDAHQSLASQYRVAQLPTLFIVESSGVVRAVLEGPSSSDLALIRRLVGETRLSSGSGAPS